MTTLFTIIGFIGALAFASCTGPQILRVLKRKSTADISMLFIILSLIGNLCSASYIFYTNLLSGLWQIPQYLNYSIATSLVVTLLCLKLKYDGSQIKESLKKSIWNARCKILYWQHYQSAGTFMWLCFAALLALITYSIVSMMI